MLNGKEWQLQLTEFLGTAQGLLAKSEECLSHLELITNDKDAVDCLLSTLLKLASQAKDLNIRLVTDFSRQIHGLLSEHNPCANLHTHALLALKDCLTLLAWQLELIDTTTGQLDMSEDEQAELIHTLAQQLSTSAFARNGNHAQELMTQ